MGHLEQILKTKREDLKKWRGRRLPVRPTSVPPTALARTPTEGLRLICEIKKKSPSAGQLSRTLDVGARARIYEQHGAAMISVLCDGPYFGGSYDDLLAARKQCSLPLLCKEFVLDELQLDMAHAYGASAVLLIVRCLSDSDLERFISATIDRDMTPLVEVYTEEEAKRAKDAGALCFGVNARDLDTLDMDSERAARIVQSMGDQVTVAHLSGVKSPNDVRKIAKGRADAVLIGELLMRLDDPGPLLSELVAAGH